MKLALSLDALSAAGDSAWRLQADLRHWTPCRFAEDLRPGDAGIGTPAEARTWAGQRMKKDKSLGLKPAGRPGLLDFWMRGIFAHAVVHRFTAAAIPDREQMGAAIAALPPGRPWLVYLDLGGSFRALDSEFTPIIGNLEIAVRGDIASSPDHVGPEAAKDARLMTEFHRQFLAGWLEHLNSRRLGIFVPDVEKLGDEASLIGAIDAWQPEQAASPPSTEG